MVVKRHVILDIHHFKCDLNREAGSSRTKKKPGVFLVPASCAADRKVQILGRHHWQYFVICSFGAADTVGFSAIIKLYIVFFCGMILSVSIELIQYFARLGILELDDIFHNTCGTVSGYLMYRGIWLIRNNLEN